MGDRAWLARFETTRDAAAWAEAVRERRWPGVADVVAAYRSAAVFAARDADDLDAIEANLMAEPVPGGRSAVGRSVRVPVLYDGEDLAEVADRVGLTVEEVIRTHAGTGYTVRAIGFLPGFPYLGELPGPLSGLPRRAHPRARVPAGSVAIAGQQTGIYPGESPGGWHLIGRTPVVLADPARGYFAMGVGDRVRFEPIGPGRFEALRGLLLDDEAVGAVGT
ncbi:5-oxoprolinase subunit B family protein [Tautonia plasticadhaerens]|uniref:Kinase A inhibitor n=1 Tax=Tautonia plasticadhaerens TaxID=2527974 RepID=A0A518HAY0_9BACT|nr:allophanate hydrolase subunit 1 [Tautonia plasticadhaerens]QDV37999.1 Kinase A inhibitor [Tautonia plasticadhaerens]